MIIELLKSQLEAANAANITLSEEMRSMRMSFESTISDLRKTIANLEALLKERDENLNKANAQMRGLKATFLPKQSEKQKPASTEEALAKAASIYEEKVGTDSNHYYMILNSLGVIRLKYRDFKGAKEFFVKAADVAKRVFGENHPEYKKLLNHIEIAQEGIDKA